MGARRLKKPLPKPEVEIYSVQFVICAYRLLKEINKSKKVNKTAYNKRTKVKLPAEYNTLLQIIVRSTST
jgi:hypothetical protein